jgi:hypothetical protein
MAKSLRIRKELRQLGEKALQDHGWTVERISRARKSSVRRITRGSLIQRVSIKTTRDRWIAFARNDADTGWKTLPDVDTVIVAAVDPDDAAFARVHMIDAHDLRNRFDRAYAARSAAGYSIDKARGVWIPLYYPDTEEPVTHVGGGAGLDNPPIARYPLECADGARAGTEPMRVTTAETKPDSAELLTIPEAKRRLARSLGVDPSAIKITVEA